MNYSNPDKAYDDEQTAYPTPTDLPTRYETRNADKARMIGMVLVASGFEAKIFTFTLQTEDLASGERDLTADSNRSTVILRTNASYKELEAARATYREAAAQVTNDQIAAALNI